MFACVVIPSTIPIIDAVTWPAAIAHVHNFYLQRACVANLCVILRRWFDRASWYFEIFDVSHSVLYVMLSDYFRLSLAFIFRPEISLFTLLFVFVSQFSSIPFCRLFSIFELSFVNFVKTLRLSFRSTNVHVAQPVRTRLDVSRNSTYWFLLIFHRAAALAKFSAACAFIFDIAHSVSVHALRKVLL